MVVLSKQLGSIVFLSAKMLEITAGICTLQKNTCGVVIKLTS